MVMPLRDLCLIDFGPFWGPSWDPLGTPKGTPKNTSKEDLQKELKDEPVLAREREARLNERTLSQACSKKIQVANFTTITSMVLCTFEQARARHVVFGRACGAALTTPTTERGQLQFDAAIKLCCKHGKTHTKSSPKTNKTNPNKNTHKRKEGNKLISPKYLPKCRSKRFKHMSMISEICPKSSPK